MALSKGRWIRFECDGKHGKIYISYENTIDITGLTFEEIIKVAREYYGWYVNIKKDICYCPYHKSQITEGTKNVRLL